MTAKYNHQGALDYWALQPYKQRGYISSDLADEVFEALNDEAGTIDYLQGYCLDAIDVSPAGSCVDYFGKVGVTSTVLRGVSAEEVRRQAECLRVILEGLKD
jgi:hypothetical protein